MSDDMIAQTVNQYLTFKLGDELFGVEVCKAREVLDFPEVTKVPQTPEYMLGVINLRGSVVPVINLRQKFGMTAGEQTVDTCVVVMDIEVEGGSVVVGAIADSVEEVLDIDENRIEPPPRLGTQLNSEFIRGMGNLNDQFIIILNIDKVFSTDELTMIGDRQMPGAMSEEKAS